MKTFMKNESPAIQWDGKVLTLLDQRILPAKEEYIQYHDSKAAADAIRDMVVRGAPAIGVTAAYAVVLATRNRYKKTDDWFELLNKDLDYLLQARPTAINLMWAVEQMKKFISPTDENVLETLQLQAETIHQQDIDANKKLGDLGASLIQQGSGVLTHCNAGALATGGYGTALGVIRSAWRDGKLNAVYADETRPWLQGTRLTAWELLQDNIDVSLLADGASSWLMKQGNVQWVVVGSDRIAANGDVANKIGTYAVAIAARYHGVKFMVAAPTSTIDMNTATGDEIPIEVRGEKELLSWNNVQISPNNAKAWNPVFDVTPAELVDAIVTEKGIVEKPNAEKIKKMMGI